MITKSLTASASRPLRRSLSSTASLNRQTKKFNTIINFVPERERWIVESFGKYHKELGAGIQFVTPFIQTIAYVQNMKEQAIHIDRQQAITSDNVMLHLTGVLYLKVVDAHKCSYGVDDPEDAITQLAQTTMRAAIGGMSLDQCFSEREALNARIVQQINKASEAWGIDILRYEIKDIEAPIEIQAAMEKEVAAERSKRATILEAEAAKEAAINQAEGEKQAVLKKAQAEAKAITLVAEAQAQKILTIGNALATKEGSEAAALSTAEKYIDAYGNLAQKSTTILLPNDPNNVAGTVASALGTFNTLKQNSQLSGTAKDVEDVLTDELDNKFASFRG